MDHQIASLSSEQAVSLIDKIRNNLSYYCISACLSKCCKRGKIMMNSENHKDSFVQAISCYSDVNFDKSRMIQRDDGLFALSLPPGCPHLDSENKCKIYFEACRPVVCHDFPVFLHGKTIIVAEICPKSNEIFETVNKCVGGLGYKVLLV